MWRDIQARSKSIVDHIKFCLRKFGVCNVGVTGKDDLWITLLTLAQAP